MITHQYAEELLRDLYRILGRLRDADTSEWPSVESKFIYKLRDESLLTPHGASGLLRDFAEAEDRRENQKDPSDALERIEETLRHLQERIEDIPPIDDDL
jgi:hypothetical protein